MSAVVDFVAVMAGKRKAFLEGRALRMCSGALGRILSIVPALPHQQRKKTSHLYEYFQ